MPKDTDKLKGVYLPLQSTDNTIVFLKGYTATITVVPAGGGNAQGVKFVIELTFANGSTTISNDGSGHVSEEHIWGDILKKCKDESSPQLFLQVKDFESTNNVNVHGVITTEVTQTIVAVEQAAEAKFNLSLVFANAKANGLQGV